MKRKFGVLPLDKDMPESGVLYVVFVFKPKETTLHPTEAETTIRLRTES